MADDEKKVTEEQVAPEEITDEELADAAGGTFFNVKPNAVSTKSAKTQCVNPRM